MKEVKPINIAVIGGGHSAKLFGAMDMVEGFAVQSVGYATRSGKHADAVGRGGRLLDWGPSSPGSGLSEKVHNLLTHKEPPHAVILAVPPFLTSELLEIVLEKTPPETAIHVEKPVGLDPADTIDNADKIHKTIRLVTVGYQWIANPPISLFEQEVHARLDKGEEIEKARGRWHGNTFYMAKPWWRLLDQSGGPLKEQGHPGHLLQHELTGRLGELRVSDHMSPQAYYGVPGELPGDVDPSRHGKLYVPTQIKAELVFANGTPVTLEASGIHEGQEVVDVAVKFHNGTVVTFGKRAVIVREGDKIATRQDTDYPTPAFKEQMTRFLHAATGNSMGPLVTYDEGRQALTLADDIMHRAQTSAKPLFV